MTDAEFSDSVFIDAARRAAPAFGLDPAEITILNRSENVVCKLTMGDGERVAMRLHRPGYNTVDELRSEVQWVQALGDAGLPVPLAVPVTDDSHYSSIDIDLGAGPIAHHVGVVEWVNGEPLGDPLSASDQDLSHHYERIGEITAQIRNHSESWTPPPSFVRRRWDVESLLGDAPLWGRFWDAPSATAAQREVLQRVRVALTEDLSKQPTTPDRFGLIHADLHLGNVMADGNDITIIDFDDAGFGWFAYELAVSLTNVLDEPWFDAARTAMYTGYRRFYELSDSEEQLVDTLVVMRSVMIVGWLTARPELPVYEWLDDVVADAVRISTTFLENSGRAATD